MTKDPIRTSRTEGSTAQARADLLRGVQRQAAEALAPRDGEEVLGVLLVVIRRNRHGNRKAKQVAVAWGASAYEQLVQVAWRVIQGLKREFEGSTGGRIAGLDS